ncbi:uncharacterized protein MONBRDRAFT_35038 [Monosiga brevicollis MX1]|uniref:Ribosomal RNA-processing protein 44 n=1 Tax=Monosiga brevicollis TaxID=81824 RepID=A9UUC9_MONBE|nr:uncharacterized protein MONBRDRAFT_35038 [Monosiga brevicollis MX1]EDQ90882.1 predicted protein [Monosiga brevicollis MX1]|eukprot:XP_001744179.1 hypothetical protein [Monosiga brevicollis MX1]
MLKKNNFSKKTRKGAVLKVSREHYLRDDIHCRLHGCTKCQQTEPCLEPGTVLVPDTNAVLHQLDVLEHPSVKNVVLTTTVLDEVKHRSLAAYQRIRGISSDAAKRFYVFSNEHSKDTHVTAEEGESPNDRNDRAIRRAAAHYKEHAETCPEEFAVILLTNDAENLRRARNEGLAAYSVHEWAKRFGPSPDLVDLLATISDAVETAICKEDETTVFEAHLSPAEVQGGLKAGKLVQGTLRISRENTQEAFVKPRDDPEHPVFVPGNLMNRAVDGDLVALQILPESQWQTPSGIIERPEGTHLVMDGTQDAEGELEDMQERTQRTGQVVGIVRRRWRPYCGILAANSNTASPNLFLFTAKEATLPPIRFRSQQPDKLVGQQIVLAVDGWPTNSKYPIGHLVRVLGPIGDVNTETEVVLLEHAVPFEPFSKAVLDCLPDATWLAAEQDLSRREDLRHLEVCSIDPPGCTDIDDALHLRDLPNGHFEVGVHIADVSHFIKPNTALDQEAAKRGTTVYLSNRRIDMVPGLLSSNLCSLRGGEERFAFSCIWEMTDQADIISTRFCKSIIRSRAALEYSEAQARIDDETDQTTLTDSIRRLNALAKIVKRRRIEAGALMLASPEVRFRIDTETHDPVDVQMKQLHDTNSLVEEFMLLANVSSAREIHKQFPTCAVLRRHPAPPPSNFEPLLKAAEAAGVTLSTTSSKELAVSLDMAQPEGQPYMNTLLRILATRCMLPAQYFCSGTVPQTEFGHYGLASPIYTHFTSPIRRYADLLVHRLLAACIGADPTYPDLLNKDKIASICDNLNFRNRQAQYAARSSLELHTCLFFKKRTTHEEAYIIRVRKNAIAVLVPAYGLEGRVYFDAADGQAPELSYDENKMALTVTKDDQHINLRVFDKVKVQVQVDSSDPQREQMLVRLVEPSLPGVTVQSTNTDAAASPKKSKKPAKMLQNKSSK